MEAYSKQGEKKKKDFRTRWSKKIKLLSATVCRIMTQQPMHLGPASPTLYFTHYNCKA